MNHPFKSYAAEFIGTFALVFMGTAVATLQGFLDYGSTGWLGISFAFGFTLMGLVWAVGPVSGCHVNPAVTLPMAAAGRLSWSLVPGYIIAQFLGALAASALLLALMKGLPGYELAKHGVAANGNPQQMSIATLFGWELIMTALFLLTIFSVTRKESPPGFAGLAIGGFLFVAHLVGAPLGDASLNPARSLGPAIIQGGDAMSIVWVFIASPIAGGALGLGLYRLLYKD